MYNKKINNIIIVKKINLLPIVLIIRKYKRYQWKHHKNQLQYNLLQYKIVIIKLIIKISIFNFYKICMKLINLKNK